MKYLPVILTALCLTACDSNIAAPNAGGAEARNPSTPAGTQTLIVFYDQGKTDAKRLIAAGKPWDVESVYDYPHFNAVALRVANTQNLQTVKTFYEKTERIAGE